MSKKTKIINDFTKRLFDIVAVLAASPLLIVITAVIAILIRLISGKNVIFSQQRAGKNMKPFTLYKFRTMRPDIDPFGPSPKTGADPRLTKIGNYLRLLSLDELPQFLNVLKGEMTLVGLRPLYMEQAKEWNQRQRKRLLVKPGLTGLAQISGRGSLTIEEKIELDVRYVENQTLWLDLRLILTTIFHILRPKNIYEKNYSKTEKTREKTEKK